MPVTKGQILHDSIHTGHLRDAKWDGGCQGLGGGRRGELVFNGYGASVLQKEKGFRRWMNSNVNIFNTTELCILKNG